MVRTFTLPLKEVSVLKSLIARKAARILEWNLSCQLVGEPTTKTDELGRVLSWQVVQIEYSLPTMGGWRFVAAIDHDGEENVFRAVEAVPEQYRTTDNTCDHCHQNRRRSGTFLVARGTEYRQVGSSCLQDFVGCPVAHIIKLFTAVTECLGEAEALEQVTASDATSICHFLAFVAREVRTAGFISRTKANQRCVESTADSVADIFWAKNVSAPTLSPEDKTQATAALEWARNLEPGNNDYLANIRAAALRSVVKLPHVGIVASIIPAYLNSLPKTSDSIYVGEIGKRVMMTLTVQRVVTCQTSYGIMYIHTMLDDQGNELVWKTNSRLELGSYKGKVTVKAHAEYKGVLQTEISRCVLTKMA